MRLVLLCVLATLVSGCRKKSSPEFYELESAQAILIAHEGDDALATPEMADVIARLEAIPASAIEKPRAVALASKLTADKARVTAEQARAAAEEAQAKAERAQAAEPNRGRALFAPPPPATGPSRRFLCEWTGVRFKGCLLGEFTSVEAAERRCMGGGTLNSEQPPRCSCSENPSPADVTLCEQMIAAQKKGTP